LRRRLLSYQLSWQEEDHAPPVGAMPSTGRSRPGGGVNRLTVVIGKARINARFG
jgi:hypothetical protein